MNLLEQEITHAEYLESMEQDLQLIQESGLDYLRLQRNLLAVAPLNPDCALLDDLAFTEAFGDDQDKWADNIDATIGLEGVRETITSGLKALVNMPGKISFVRVGGQLFKFSKQLEDIDETTLLTRKARSLPSFKHTNEILTGLENFQKLFESYLSNPESVTSKDVTKHFKDVGLQIGRIHRGWEDWKVLAMEGTAMVWLFSVLGKWGLLLKLLPKVAPRFAARKLKALIDGGWGFLGLIYEEGVGVIGYQPINMRGWKSKSDFIKSVNRLHSVMSDMLDLASKAERLQTLDVKGLDADKQEELKQVSKQVATAELMCRRLTRRMAYAFLSAQRLKDHVDDVEKHLG